MRDCSVFSLGANTFEAQPDPSSENQLLPRVEKINAEGTKPDIKIGRQQAPLAI